MLRQLAIFCFAISSVGAQDLESGYLAVPTGGGIDTAVVEFAGGKSRKYFENEFLTTAPHTKHVIASATKIEFRWHLVGYLNGMRIYDLFHTVEAFGGKWAVKTILLETKNVNET